MASSNTVAGQGVSATPAKPASAPRPRFLMNLGANVLNSVAGIVIGFFFTPYLIRHLGVAGYGLVPLVGNFYSYLGLLTMTINAPVGRYLTIALTRNQVDEANRVFNSALWATLGILGLCYPVLLVVCWKGLGWLNVPAGMETQFSILATCAVSMFCLSAVGSIFATSAYSCNRLDLSSIVNFVGAVGKIGTVVALFTLFSAAVWMVGAGMMVTGAVSLVLFVILWRRLTPQLRIELKSFSPDTLKSLAGFGGWSIVNQLGVILFLYIDLVVVNRMMGAESAGKYASVMVFSGLLRSMAGVVAGVFGPTIVSLYAQKNTARLISYSRQSVKFVGLIMAFPIGLICGFSRPLLGTWLGPAFEPLAPLLSLMVVHLCVNLAIAPLFNVQIATGRVRWPGLLTLGMGILNLGLAILLAGPVGWGMYGVAAAGAIMISLKNVVFTPLYVAHVLRVPWYSFFREIGVTVLSTLALIGAAAFLSHNVSLNGWFRLVPVGAGFGLVWAGAVYFVLLKAEERAQLQQMVGRLISRSA